MNTLEQFKQLYAENSKSKLAHIEYLLQLDLDAPELSKVIEESQYQIFRNQIKVMITNQSKRRKKNENFKRR